MNCTEWHGFRGALTSGDQSTENPTELELCPQGINQSQIALGSPQTIARSEAVRLRMVLGPGKMIAAEKGAEGSILRNRRKRVARRLEPLVTSHL